jgi:hypothetical protein
VFKIDPKTGGLTPREPRAQSRNRRLFFVKAQ